MMILLMMIQMFRLFVRLLDRVSVDVAKFKMIKIRLQRNTFSTLFLKTKLNNFSTLRRPVSSFFQKCLLTTTTKPLSAKQQVKKSHGERSLILGELLIHQISLNESRGIVFDSSNIITRQTSNNDITPSSNNNNTHESCVASTKVTRCGIYNVLCRQCSCCIYWTEFCCCPSVSIILYFYMLKLLLTL